MKSHIITDEEIELMKVAALPNRPTAPPEYGGNGYTAKEMKEAFDKLPLYLVARLNDLIDDIGTDSSDSVANSIKLGLAGGMTLSEFVSLFESGEILGMIPVGEDTLLGYMQKIRRDVDKCLADLGIE